jgi:cathepsin B
LYIQFSVAGAITDRLCIKKNYPTLPISAYDLMSCCGDCWLDGVNGCNGGDHDSASQYYITNGIVTGGEFRSHIGCKPYPIRPNEDAPEPQKTVCRPSCENGYNITYENDKHYGFNQTVFTLRNLDVMNEIKKNGPVVAEFEFYQDFLFYTGGIYKHLNGTLLGYRYAKVI